MRRYVIEVAIEEGNDEFWEDLKDTGCDEITKLVRESVEELFGDNFSVELTAYSQTRDAWDAP